MVRHGDDFYMGNLSIYPSSEQAENGMNFSAIAARHQIAGSRFYQQIVHVARSHKSAGSDSFLSPTTFIS